MNNIVMSLKKFLTNKNVVTIVGVIAIILVIYFGYNSQVTKATSPVSVPVAKQEIPANTKITDEMVKTISVPSVAISSNVVKSKGLVVGKYSAINTVIPAGSMFYKSAVVSEDEKIDIAYTKLKKDQVLYNFPVTITTTYGNTITPDSYVDIYMKAVDDNGEIMVGKLLENVNILAVKDSSGDDVFADLSNKKTPAFLYFGVTSDIHILLRKASYLKSKSVELFPVPHGVAVDSDELNIRVSTQYLRDFINAHTVMIDETPVDNESSDLDLTADESANE